MNINRATLIEIASREAETRGQIGDVISGYLIGSVARGEALLGGTTDIDLVLIHRDDPPFAREITGLSEEVHLDIAHHPRSLYQQPRELRVHPWLGATLCEPVFLYDPEHFFEWAQAGARGQFFRPDHMYQRAKAFIQRARQSRTLLPVTGRWVRSYLRAVLDTANAAASLSGFPVAGRRMVLDLKAVAGNLAFPELFGIFLMLLGLDHFSAWDLPETLSRWAKAFDTASEQSDDPLVAPCRRNYFLRGYRALLDDGHPQAILWTLLTSWESAMHAMNSSSEEAHTIAWGEILSDLQLSEEHQEMRSDQLEKYIDQVELFLENWAQEAGA